MVLPGPTKSYQVRQTPTGSDSQGFWILSSRSKLVKIGQTCRAKGSVFACGFRRRQKHYGGRVDATRGRGYTPSIKRQSVNTSVKPRDFAMYKRQIMCQEASAERQILPPSAVSGRESLGEFVRVLWRAGKIVDRRSRGTE